MSDTDLNALADKPKRIWLQWYGDECPEAGEPLQSVVNNDEITWCVDQINEHDLEYVPVQALRDAADEVEHWKTESNITAKSWDVLKAEHDALQARIDKLIAPLLQEAKL